MSQTAGFATAGHARKIFELGQDLVFTTDPAGTRHDGMLGAPDGTILANLPELRGGQAPRYRTTTIQRIGFVAMGRFPRELPEVMPGDAIPVVAEFDVARVTSDSATVHHVTYRVTAAPSESRTEDGTPREPTLGLVKRVVANESVESYQPPDVAATHKEDMAHPDLFGTAVPLREAEAVMGELGVLVAFANSDGGLTTTGPDVGPQ